MRVLIHTGDIHKPIAGISRYAAALLMSLRSHPHLDEITHLDHIPLHPDTAPSPAERIVAALKRGLAEVGAAGSLYGAWRDSKYRRILRSSRHGVYHGADGFAVASDMATVVTLHDFSALANPRWQPAARSRLVERAIDSARRYADLVITPSARIGREATSSFGFDSDKVCVIHHGVSPVFRVASADSLKSILPAWGMEAGKYSLCVATIEPRKNIHRLIAAYRTLPQPLRMQIPLVLVGGVGWNSEAEHRSIREAHAQGWLRYLDHVVDDCLPALYAGARVFVYPSLYEGFGLPVAEAMASGVPVVTSAGSAMAEVAGEAAILVDPLDIDAIRDGLALAMQDDAWRAEAIRRGLARSAELTWAACADATVDAYRRARTCRE